MIATLLRALISGGLMIACAIAADDPREIIWIHLCGQANKPGSHGIPAECSVEELEKACGGWTQFGSGKRLYVIRFPRPEGLVGENPPDDRKQEILQTGQLGKKGERFIFKPGDIIYIPQKILTGR